METYCVKCKKQTKFEGEPIVTITKNNRHMLKGKCIECGKTKTRFISKTDYEKFGKGLLGKLFKLPGNKIPILGDIPLIGKLLF